MPAPAPQSRPVSSTFLPGDGRPRGARRLTGQHHGHAVNHRAVQGAPGDVGGDACEGRQRGRSAAAGRAPLVWAPLPPHWGRVQGPQGVAATGRSREDPRGLPTLPTRRRDPGDASSHPALLPKPPCGGNGGLPRAAPTPVTRHMGSPSLDMTLRLRFLKTENSCGRPDVAHCLRGRASRPAAWVGPASSTSEQTLPVPLP